MRIRTVVLIAAVAAACGSPRQPSPGADSGMDSAGAPAPALRDSGMKSPTDSGMGLRGDQAPAEDARVRLRVDRASYAPGGAVRLTIVNGGPVPLGYNACTRQVERRDGSAWAAVPEPDRMCTMELRILAPGDSTTAATELPASLAAGEHRVTLVMTPESDAPPPAGATPAPMARVKAVSAGFRVSR